MPPKKKQQNKKFESNGEFALSITRYFLQKAKEALEVGVNASEADFSWDTFKKEAASLAQSIADNHPGGEADHFRLCRNNFKSQLEKRFLPWLSKGTGYPKKFAKEAGLIDSGLGGSEGDIRAGSDSDASEESDSSSEVPFADFRSPNKKTSKKKTPTKSPAPAPAAPSFVDLDLDDLTASIEEFCFDEEEDEMQIITSVEKHVEVTAFAPVRFQDLLFVQALLPGCAVTQTIRIAINRNDPNKGTIFVDQDPHLVVGTRRTKKEWRNGNAKLNAKVEALIELEMKKKVVKGSTPACTRMEGHFSFPDDLPAQLNPIDPFVIGFRAAPTAYGDTMFETKTIKCMNRSGKFVPGILVTAFFFVEKFTHISDAAGRGLRIDVEASDSDSDSSTPRSRKKRRTPATSSRGGVEETKSAGDTAPQPTNMDTSGV